jgi:hypothetical protein
MKFTLSITLIIILVTTIAAVPLWDGLHGDVAHFKRAPLASCPTVACANAGQSCMDDSDHIVSPYCVNSYCDTTNSSNAVCAALVSNGGTCTDSIECASQRCRDGKCVNLHWSATCSSTDDCDEGYQCMNSRCVGAATGAACSGNCTNFLESCIARTCQPTPKVGESCTSGRECVLGAACMPTSSDPREYVCVKLFSVGVGGACNDADVCTQGLSCYQGVCTAVSQTGSNRLCNSSLECDTQEYCVCTSGQQRCRKAYDAIPSGYPAIYTAATDCAAAKCAGKNYEECTFNECLSKYCDLVRFVMDNQDYSSTPTCYKDYQVGRLKTARIPPQCPSSASSFTPGFFLILAFFALLCLCC